ncbi:putative DNA-directed RNA polymerase III subunit rpc9 [Rosellinia necatrix]|uniref:DNA-directed RNA polymerase III subunit RPC9 n=1 Tax=Rosellinia necatrix TaxID=77044 RepID=A0A1W2TK45_ROSNE|nr:putative DNA-directed RNA polymerase III subunit rpc9 [Rosellinia necatrix]
MRILEAQNAVLTNVEVYTFLSDQAKQYQEQKRRGPPNLEALRGEVLNYFETFPGPLSQKPLPYDTASIPVLLQKLRPYKITKGECIMVLNMRPTGSAALNTVLEDMETRFDAEQQEEIIRIIVEFLGEFPPAPEEEEDGMETTEDGRS